MKFRSDDRVLSLAVLPVQETAALARVLLSGCLVVLGNAEEVHEGRRAFAAFDNVMFVEADPTAGPLPWRDAFFTKAIVPPHFEEFRSAWDREVCRVLVNGGELTSTSVAV